jgi:hypothetical protein
MLEFFVAGMRRAVPVYLPIHVLGLVMAKHKSLWTFAENMLRSCLFLSLYCADAWLGVCLISSISPGMTRAKLCLGSSVAGLAVVLERPGRRVELAHYCAAQAINCLWRMLLLRGFVRSRAELCGPLLSLAMALVLATLENQPQFLIQTLLGLKLVKKQKEQQKQQQQQEEETQ